MMLNGQVVPPIASIPAVLIIVIVLVFLYGISRLRRH